LFYYLLLEVSFRSPIHLRVSGQTRAMHAKTADIANTVQKMEESAAFASDCMRNFVEKFKRRIE
jgi:hypothetical protein